MADLGDVLKGKKKPAALLPSPADAGGTDTGGGAGAGIEGGDGDPAKFRHDEISGGNQGGTDKQGTEPKTKPKATPGTDGGTDGDDTGAGGTEPGDLGELGELTSWPRGKAVSDPDAMKKPLLLVEYEGRAAAVLLTERTCSPLSATFRCQEKAAVRRLSFPSRNSSVSVGRKTAFPDKRGPKLRHDEKSVGRVG